jgi:adenylate cyclase
MTRNSNRFDRRASDSPLGRRAPRVGLLELKSASARVEVGRSRRKATIGRDRNADIPIRDPHASRAHATIERDGDSFFLVDHSTNGTYVTVGDELEVLVLGEEMALHGQGVIALGRPLERAQELVEFRCLQAIPPPQ